MRERARRRVDVERIEDLDEMVPAAVIAVGRSGVHGGLQLGLQAETNGGPSRGVKPLEKTGLALTTPACQG